MDKVKCGVIRDLLPLVVDEVATEDSVELVKTHMEECESCRGYYEGMTAAIARTNVQKPETDNAVLRLGKKIKFQTNMRKWLTVALAGILAFVIIVAGFTFVDGKVSIYNVDMDPDWADVQLYYEPNGTVGARIDMRDGRGWYNCLQMLYRDGILYLMPMRPEWTALNKGNTRGENFPLYEYYWQDGKIVQRINDGDVFWNPDKNLWEEVIEEIIRPVYTVRWGTMENYNTLYVEGDEIPSALEIRNTDSEVPIVMTGIKKSEASDQTIIVKEDTPAEADGETLKGAALKNPAQGTESPENPQ